jgi:hypothetical protein
MVSVSGLRRGLAVRRKEKTLPTLLLPLTRGPIQGFYHFLLGYFIPVYWQRIHNPDERLVLMSVPSFDHWFHLLPGGQPKLIDPAKAAKHALLRNRRGFSSHYRLRALQFWDKWEKFDEKPLKAIAERLHDDLSKRFAGKQTSSSDVLVLGRSPIKRYPGEEFTRPSGDLARTISNLSEVRAALSEEFVTDFLDGSVTSPEEAFLKCQGARLILGQHGAGLSNVVFARPGAAMTEVIWPALRSRAQVDIYGNLCDALGVRWSRPALQADPQSAIDPDSVVREVKEMLGN